MPSVLAAAWRTYAISHGENHCRCRATSAAHLTLDTHVRPGSRSSVRCISCATIIDFLLFLVVLTFARDLAAAGSKCQNRNTSAAHLTLDTQLRLGSQSSVRWISCTHMIKSLVFLVVLTFARDLAAAGSKCQNRNTSAYASVTQPGGRGLSLALGRRSALPRSLSADLCGFGVTATLSRCVNHDCMQRWSSTIGTAHHEHGGRSLPTDPMRRRTMSLPIVTSKWPSPPQIRSTTFAWLDKAAALVAIVLLALGTVSPWIAQSAEPGVTSQNSGHAPGACRLVATWQ